MVLLLLSIFLCTILIGSFWLCRDPEQLSRTIHYTSSTPLPLVASAPSFFVPFTRSLFLSFLYEMRTLEKYGVYLVPKGSCQTSFSTSPPRHLLVTLILLQFVDMISFSLSLLYSWTIYNSTVMRTDLFWWTLDSPVNLRPAVRQSRVLPPLSHFVPLSLPLTLHLRFEAPFTLFPQWRPSHHSALFDLIVHILQFPT